MKKSKSELGFGVVEVFVCIIVLTVLCGIAWMLYAAGHDKNDTSDLAPKSNKETVSGNDNRVNYKTYTNSSLRFSFEYPDTWKVKANDGFFITQDEPTVDLVISTEDNKSFMMTAHYGGKGGGPCVSLESDEFHSVASECATTEILNIEKTDYSVQPQGVYKDLGPYQLYIVDRKITVPEKFSNNERPAGTTYEVCMAFDNPEGTYLVKGARFDWGISPIPSPIFRDIKPDFFYLESCFSNTSEAFLKSSVAESTRNLYRSIELER